MARRRSHPGGFALSDTAAVVREAVQRPRESADTQYSDRVFRVMVGLVLAGALILHFSASLMLRGMFGDSSWWLVDMLSFREFVLDVPARWATSFLQEAPTALALKLGMMDLIGLAMLYSATMELLPLAFVAGSYLLLPKGEKAFFIFPLVFYLAGAEAAAFEPITEGKTATAYFWFLLFAIVFRAKSPVWQMVTLAAAIPAVQSDE